MLQIDGCYGEGGGQILRYATALSVLTKTPIRITNIRANRPNPGIRPQHLAALSLLKQLSNATTDGLSIASKTLLFEPTTLQPGTYTYDIGTAGSIPLVYQAILLAILKTAKPFTIILKGGTDVKWAPSWDYFTNIFLAHLKNMGIQTQATLHQRGYYPKGGGQATLHVKPPQTITPLRLKKDPHYTTVQGIVHLANLPDHIGTRIKHTVMKKTLTKNLATTIDLQTTAASNPGTGLTLWTQSETALLGSTVLGEKGIPAEQIAQYAVEDIINQIKHRATIDHHALDQLLPYLALQNQSSECRVTTISLHAKTTMYLLSQFFTVQFQTQKTETNYHVTIIGC